MTEADFMSALDGTDTIIEYIKTFKWQAVMDQCTRNIKQVKGFTDDGSISYRKQLMSIRDMAALFQKCLYADQYHKEISKSMEKANQGDQPAKEV